MQHNFLSIFFILLSSFLWAQQKNPKDGSGGSAIAFSGFVKYEIFFDTRLNEEAIDGMVDLYPKFKQLDVNGKDVNAISTLNMLALSTRLKTDIIGPDIFGAKTSGLIEFDFTGRSNTAASRFREAWIRFRWENTDVMVGRHWHPLFVLDVYPSVMAMSVGAPFQVFNRSEQFTIKQYFGNFNLLASLVYQNDYNSPGPDGKSPNYIRWSGIPDMNLQFQYKSESLIAGIAGEYKIIKPRILTTSLVNINIFSTSERLGTYAFMSYLKFQRNKLLIKGKALLGQNLTEHLLTGGYAVSAIDSTTGHETYTPSNNLYLWANMIYGDKWKIGIFGAYSKNLGFSDNIINKRIDGNGKIIDNIYGSGYNLANLYRIQPTIYYKTGPVQFSLEYERTVASYGNIDLGDFGKVKNTETVGNNRLLFTIMYSF